MLNGSFTTDTIVYWLWSNGSTDYTYDPDGDAIVGRYLGGINEYVLGNVAMGDTIVGFATQFTVAAQHELIYYVEDEHGAFSDVLRYSFVVEAADGNRRPICIVSPSVTNPAVGQTVRFSWASSYDPDGESLSSIRVRVTDSAGNSTNVNSSSKYYVAMTNSYIDMKFDQIGRYSIRIELSDVNNNWSNWSTTTINVTEAGTMKNVTLYADDHNNTH